MSRNPYSGLSANADLNPNGNSYGASADIDDYDPYGDRYGTPPMGGAASMRRGAIRAGGGFYETNNSSASSLQPSSQPPQQSERYDTYISRLPDDLIAGRRPGGSNPSNVRRMRPDGRDTDSSDGSRGREYNRSGEQSRQNDDRAGRDAVLSRGGTNEKEGGSGTRQIDGCVDASSHAEVLHYIQTEWWFMAQDSCMPVKVALELMDSSSLGRAHQYEEFQQTHRQLQRALKAIVNEYHQGFNSSIGTFHKIQSSIQSSQNRLRTLKESLVQSKVGLSIIRPELKGLASTSQSYEEMLLVLSQIEQLRLVTDKLEARISEKRFLTAVDILQDALRMLRKPEMDNISALSDLRVYLANQEISLTDILIEELHGHLYLKSPYCQDRWKAHAKEQSDGASSEGKSTGATNVLPLHQLLDELDLSEPMVEDASRNPEADSFYYIRLLVESLNKMGRLDLGVNAIEQRLPVELFRVVDKTNCEVDQRHPTSLRGKFRDSNGKFDFGIGENDIRAVVIYDLLWTLYAKFEAIAEGHRVFHDVVIAITKRENTRNAELLTGSFKEVWMLYQNEMRSLLHDYLATDNTMYRMSQSIEPSSGDVLKRGQRKRDKKIFSLSDTDPHSAVVTAEYEDLDSILKASVPGLVSDSKAIVGIAADDKIQQTDGAATGHKLLIEPSVFNMGLLLPPSLAFLQRLKDIVPLRPDIKTSTLTSFLDDFLVNVFLPQLDETLIKLSSQVFEGQDAFQEDTLWSQVAKRPIFYGTSEFFNLITVFCRMLDTIPHDQAFSQLIITQMETYGDRCFEWYKALVAITPDNSSYDLKLKASATFASDEGEIHDIMRKLWAAEGDEHELLLKEAGLLILQTNETSLKSRDIIPDRKTIASLCLLYSSMKWLASKIERLRHITPNGTDSSRRSAMRTSQNRRWTLFGDTSRIGDEKTPVYLPMTQETVTAFDTIISSYHALADTVLRTIHAEIRCQIIHSLSLVLSPENTTYLLNHVVNDPDSRIITLNTDLISYDETITRFLRDKEISFACAGLGLLADSFLVTNAGSTKVMNANGCVRMKLNILVLQQNLKNIEQSASLRRSVNYYDLFMEGPDAVIRKAKEQKEAMEESKVPDRVVSFSYDELKTLVELCFSEQLANPERGVNAVAKRSVGEYVLQLSEYLWQN